MFSKMLERIFKKNKYSNNNQNLYNIQNDLYENYFSGIEEIESMWSVMYNLKIVFGPQTDEFEKKCFQNIQIFNQLPLDFTQSVKNVPAYVRLSMLYEKQERYDEAISICSEAIKRGYTCDNSKGQMYGRLARLIRKSGKQVDEELIKLSQHH